MGLRPAILPTFYTSHVPRPTPLRTKDEDVGSRERKGRRFASSISSPRTIAPLLLTGDERFISEDGKSRTVYSLDFRSMDFKVTPANIFVLEETYDIENVKKRISLVASLNKESSNSDDASVDLFSFDLQEINNGYKTAGKDQ